MYTNSILVIIFKINQCTSACPTVSSGNASVTYSKNISEQFVPENECVTLACNFDTEVLIMETYKFIMDQTFYCKDGEWVSDPNNYFCIPKRL